MFTILYDSLQDHIFSVTSLVIIGMHFVNFEFKLMPFIGSFNLQRGLLKNRFSTNIWVRYDLKFHHHRNIFDIRYS